MNPAYTYVDKDGEIHLSTGAFVNGVVFQDSMQNGIYQSQKDGKTYVYIQGELTPTDNIPKSGEARYLGLSSYHVIMIHYLKVLLILLMALLQDLVLWVLI